MLIFHNIQIVKNRKDDLIPHLTFKFHIIKLGAMKDDDTGLMA
jgi:hypothetical protein